MSDNREPHELLISGKTDSKTDRYPSVFRCVESAEQESTVAMSMKLIKMPHCFTNARIIPCTKWS